MQLFGYPVISSMLQVVAAPVHALGHAEQL